MDSFRRPKPGRGHAAGRADNFALPLEKAVITQFPARCQSIISGGNQRNHQRPRAKTTPGSLDILFDQSQYTIGDKATALITFPEAVDEALLSLERDGVEQTALLTKGGSWLNVTKLNAQQYQVVIPVGSDFAPNITFSVVYSQHKDFSFQNAGIKVAKPMLAVQVSADKTDYAPGQTVNLTIKTQYLDKPVAALVALSVVDDMIYTLQPEIAPSIEEFLPPAPQ